MRKEKLLQVYSNPGKPQDDDSADERENFLYGIEFPDPKADKKDGSKKPKAPPKKDNPKEKKKRDPLRDSKDSTPSNGFFGGDINFTEPEKVWIQLQPYGKIVRRQTEESQAEMYDAYNQEADKKDVVTAWLENGLNVKTRGMCEFQKKTFDVNDVYQRPNSQII